VAVVSTGDELIDPLDEKVAAPGFAPEFGRIMNSNLFLLYGLLVKSGVKAELCGIAKDTPEEIAAKIAEGMAKADIVITTGGASVGSYDYIPDALGLLGFEVNIWKMAIKPGRPFIFGVKKEGRRNKLVFGLPGNPASSLVSFVKILRPALYKYAGRTNPKEILAVSGALSETVKRDSARATFLRAFMYNAPGGGAAQPVISVPSKQDSNILTTALYANCLAEIPAGAGVAAKGDIVSAQII
jgi:molybdopterin molybdotransferase